MNGKIFRAHGLEELIVRMSIVPTLQNQCNPYRNSNGICNKNRINNPKISMEPQKDDKYPKQP